jgi:hypothetical protein
MKVEGADRFLSTASVGETIIIEFQTPNDCRIFQKKAVTYFAKNLK